MTRPWIYYFGCIGDAGHYMHGPRGERRERQIFDRNPWGHGVDGGLCAPGPQVQGRALLHHKDHWTALAFWDRSVDDRSGSNSVFLAEGDFDFGHMLQLAHEHFPQVFARFTFEVVPA